MMIFDNHRDAEMRLGNTILTYDKRAHKVIHVRENLKLVTVCIMDGTEFELDQKDPLLSLAPPPLGYLNGVAGCALYAMRQPARRWKQGLDARSLYFVGRRGMVRNIPDRVLAQCLENDYPDYEKAMKGFNCTNPFKPDATKSIAFSKNFALERGEGGMLLSYKGKNVGKIEEEAPVLDEKFIWLRESLEGVMG